MFKGLLSNTQRFNMQDDMNEENISLDDHHLKTGQFDNQICLDHLNTRLVQYSDSYFIQIHNV